MALKGKEAAGKSSAAAEKSKSTVGKRKAVSKPSAAAEKSKSTVGKRRAVSKPSAAAEKSGSSRKRMRDVADFFDDEAVDADSDGLDESDGGDEDDRDFLDDVVLEGKNERESGMFHLPFLVKEEELSDEELENLLKQRYEHVSEMAGYADESKDNQEFDDREALMASMKGPTIWRVKCSVGREQYIAFCLIQKYFDVLSLGTKLPMISVLALEHMKGYIYIEADRQFDVTEACRGVCNIYPSKISLVPKSEVPHLLSARDKVSEVSEGSWVRVKYGTYKGDLAQVVAVDNAKKCAAIKLVPRIDLQALSQKLGSGVPLKQAVVPAPRLISSRELEAFQTHIQRKHDRLTGENFDTIDGLMLKNGYLYKKLSFGSLSCWEVQPLPEEKEKFKVVDDSSENSDWLSDIYQARRKIHTGSAGKGTGETSEGISEADADRFELHDLVVFGGTDFGVIVGMESHTFQILRGDPERADTVAINIWDVKNKRIDKTISAPDMHKNILTVDDRVRVSKGQYKGREGIVKHIYGDIIFIHDSSHLENDGFLCAQSEFCEAIKYSADAHEMEAPPGFDNPIETPNIPQSPEKPYKWRETDRPFNRDQGDRDRTFSIGQTLRIRIGPLKGHLCRVVAVYHSDVTVKLDSQSKVIKVNSKHLSEAGIRTHSNLAKEPWQSSSATEFLGGSTSVNPFVTLSSNDNDRTANPWESAVFGSGNQSKSMDSWNKTAHSCGDKNAAWNKATEEEKAVVSNDQTGSWDAHTWDKSTAKTDNGSGWTDSWQKKVSGGDQVGSLNDAGGWGKEKSGTEPRTKESSSWTDSWEKKISNSDLAGTSNDAGSWEKAKHETEFRTGTANSIDGWGKTEGAANDQGDCWNKLSNYCGKGKGIAQGNDANETNSWDKAFQSQSKVCTGEKEADDPWGRSASGWNGVEGCSGNQQGSWNNSTSVAANQGEQVGGWNNSKSASGGQSRMWDKFKTTDKEDSGGWNKKSQTDGWNQTKPSGGNWKSDWGGDEKGDHRGGWSKRKDFDGGQGSDWNRGKVGTDEGNGGRDQEDGWKKQNTFGGGWGFGGRRGRGGNRGRGGRDFSDREKSYGDDQGSGWSGDRDGRSNETHGWNKENDSDGGWGSGWNSGRSDFRGRNENDGDGCNKARASGGGCGFGGRRGRGGGRGGGRGRGGRDYSGRDKPFGDGQGSSWNGDGGKRDQARDWNEDGGSGSGWGAGFEGGSADQEDSWNKAKSFDGSQGFGGRRGRGRGNRGREYSGRGKYYDRDQSSGWNRDGENSWRGGRGSDSAFSGWSSRNQDASGSENQTGGWRASDENNESGWKTGWRASDENNESGWKKGMWSKGKEDSGSGWKASDGDLSAGWSKGWSGSKDDDDNGTKSSAWKSDGGNGSNWNKGWATDKETGGSEGMPSGWGKDQPEGHDDGKAVSGNKSVWGSSELRSWNMSNTSGGNQPSTWEKGSAANNESGGGWNRGNATDSVHPQGGGWNGEAAPKKGWGSGYQTGTSVKATGSRDKCNDGSGSSQGGW